MNYNRQDYLKASRLTDKYANFFAISKQNFLKIKLFIIHDNTTNPKELNYLENAWTPLLLPLTQITKLPHYGNHLIPPPATPTTAKAIKLRQLANQLYNSWDSLTLKQRITYLHLIFGTIQMQNRIIQEAAEHTTIALKSEFITDKQFQSYLAEQLLHVLDLYNFLITNDPTFTEEEYNQLDAEVYLKDHAKHWGHEPEETPVWAYRELTNFPQNRYFAAPKKVSLPDLRNKPKPHQFPNYSDDFRDNPKRTNERPSKETVQLIGTRRLYYKPYITQLKEALIVRAYSFLGPVSFNNDKALGTLQYAEDVANASRHLFGTSFVDLTKHEDIIEQRRKEDERYNQECSPVRVSHI